MRPARKASRPASTAFFIALAISTGSLAAAIAVFISTPSQPSSIAIAASEAVPTPASTSTGTFAFSTISRMFQRFWIPRPEPIGAGVDHHLELFGNQTFRCLQRLHDVGVQCFLVTEHLEFDQVLAVEQLA